MATAANPVNKPIKCYAFHTIFGPSAGGCSGACNYTWDSLSKEYVLDAGDACTGTGCAPCARTLPDIVRELIVVERCFPHTDAITYSCGGTIEQSRNAVLGLYVALLKKYKVLVKTAVALAIVSAVLSIAVIYLRFR